MKARQSVYLVVVIAVAVLFITTQYSYHLVRPDNVLKALNTWINVSPTNTALEPRWMTVNSESNTRIFSAYFDIREEGQLKVTILGLQNHSQVKQPYYCLVRYPNETEVCLKELSQQEPLNPWDDNKDKVDWAFSFTCRLNWESLDNIIESDIALSMDKECDSHKSDWIPISVNREKLFTFGVCIETALFGQITPMELVIEGIERNRALGADWITVYVQDTTEDIMKVLKDYEKEGILEIVDWSLPQEEIQRSKYYAESVSIADCLYRNMYRVKYLAFVDLDEIIVPQNHNNWTDMIAAVDDTNIAAFQFSHAATHPNTQLQGEFNLTCQVKDSERRITQHTLRLPIYLRNSYRTPPYNTIKNLTVSLREKTIVKPVLVERMAIHTGISFLHSSHQILVPPEIGLVYHYRTPPLCQNCIKVLQEDHRIQDLVPNLFATIRERLCRYL